MQNITSFGLMITRVAKVGLHPTTRHDGTVWLPSESLRATRSGDDLGFHCATIGIRGDWAEFARDIRPNVARPLIM